MAPTFNKDSFIFEEGEDVEHEEGYAFLATKNRRKWHLMGLDTFSGEHYPVAVNIDDLATASLLAQARMRELEKTQPTATSGGQNGIQDKVYIVHPGEQRYN